MRARRLGIVIGLAVVLAISMVSPVVAGTPARGMVTACLVSKASPDAERTVHVPKSVADVLVAVTASYRGPCAAYGESAARGDGWMTAYSQAEHQKPTAVGVVMSTGTLTGLPHDPPTDGKWCYDKDEDGSVDPMAECANGYGNILRLDQGFRRHVDTPFRYLMVDWNPHGHGPPDVYDLPHFDVHFYLQSNDERRAIRPGPCPELVDCDDYELGKKLPADEYLPADFSDLDALSPGMGNHLIDRTGPEFHGERFTHTFIYGTWDRDVTFYEPMVTKEHLQALVDGARQDTCAPIKTPAAFQKAGWYPTNYCMRFRENRDEITISVEDFVHRAAG